MQVAIAFCGEYSTNSVSDPEIFATMVIAEPTDAALPEIQLCGFETIIERILEQNVTYAIDHPYPNPSMRALDCMKNLAIEATKEGLEVTIAPHESYSVREDSKELYVVWLSNTEPLVHVIDDFALALACGNIQSIACDLMARDIGLTREYVITPPTATKKCPACGSSMIRSDATVDIATERGRKAQIRNIEHWHCPSCEENCFDNEDLDTLDAQTEKNESTMSRHEHVLLQAWSNKVRAMCGKE